MKGKVNKHVMEELARFGEWCSEKSKQGYSIRDFEDCIRIVSFAVYLENELGLYLRRDFYHEKYKSLVKVYEEYYDQDGYVLEDYENMEDILQVFGEEYQEWLDKKYPSKPKIAGDVTHQEGLNNKT